MKVKILIALGILIVISVFIYKTVSPKNEQYYTRHFYEKEQGLTEIKNYLLEKYASDSALRGKVRLIFINPNKVEKNLKNRNYRLEPCNTNGGFEYFRYSP